jgi:dual specificity phosphatase 12
LETSVLDISEIIPGRLWVGAYVRAEEVSELERIGITTVISMQTDEDLLHCGISPGKLAGAYSTSRIEYVRMPVPDFDRNGLARGLPAAVAEIERRMVSPATRVYLHCTAGVNRSATAAAGYLIRSRGISVCEAVTYLTSRRDCDPTFDILEEYEIALTGAPRDRG